MSHIQPQLLTLQNLKIEVLFFWCSCALVLLSLVIPIFRYFSYAVPFGFVFALLARAKFCTEKAPYPYIVILIAALLYALIFGTDINGIQDLYLILIGLTPFLTTYTPKFEVEKVTVVVLGGFVLFAVLAFISGGATSSKVDLLKSSSPLESGFSFVFGLLVIVALIRKKYVLLFICILLTLVSLKRIALLGVLVCVVVWLAPARVRKICLSPLSLIFANSIFIFLAVNFALGNYDRLIYELTGSSANAFAMGRRELYYYPALQIINSFDELLLIGNGSGSSYSAVNWGINAYQKRLLHSDVIKIFYEYGGLVLLTFIALMFHGQPLYIRIVWLYTNILLLTDNVLIYPYYVFSVCLVTSMLRGHSRESKRDHERA